MRRTGGSVAILTAGAIATAGLAACEAVVPTANDVASPPASAAAVTGGPAVPTAVRPTITASSALVGLVMLAGPADALRLERAVDGTADRLALPGNDSRWVSGDPRRGLVLTVGARGTLFVAAPFGSAQPTWKRLAPRLPAGRTLRHPLAFATMSSDGSRIVAVADDPGSGGTDGQLAVIDAATGASSIIDLGAATDGRPPAWFGADSVILPDRDAADRNELSVIDLATGHRRVWAHEAGAFCTSADGSTVALQMRLDDRLLVGTAEDLETGRPLTEVPRDLQSGGDGRGATAVAGQLLLDDAGRRLAVTWLDDAGDTRAISVYLRDGNTWSIARRGPLPPDTTRVVLAGFDP
jgi:hypothetical protein